jgi:2',3'-cyclic-nucleotide 2'-phosphodiesterase (5'-nucleotidase family)
MKKVNVYLLGLFACFSFACTKNHYKVASVESSRIEINGAWDAKANTEMTALVESYKTKMKSELHEIIGTATQTLEKGYPQSLLSNFSADAMKAIGDSLWGSVDFAVMNVGGLRSSLAEGPVSIENMYEIYSFDNSLVLLELPGKAVKRFFEFIAFNGGQGLSKDVCLAVKARSVESLKIGGKPLDENKTYRISTIDYLADGNDGMEAFKKASNRIDSNKTLRDLMIQYIKNLTVNNQRINAAIDNRITIKK